MNIKKLGYHLKFKSFLWLKSNVRQFDYYVTFIKFLSEFHRKNWSERPDGKFSYFSTRKVHVRPQRSHSPLKQDRIEIKKWFLLYFAFLLQMSGFERPCPERPRRSSRNLNRVLFDGRDDQATPPNRPESDHFLNPVECDQPHPRNPQVMSSINSSWMIDYEKSLKGIFFDKLQLTGTLGTWYYFTLWTKSCADTNFDL